MVDSHALCRQGGGQTAGHIHGLFTCDCLCQQGERFAVVHAQHPALRQGAGQCLALVLCDVAPEAPGQRHGIATGLATLLRQAFQQCVGASVGGLARWREGRGRR